MYVIATTDDTEPAPYIGSRKTTLDVLARLEWKTEPPTEPGYYWINELINGESVLSVHWFTYACSDSIITHWLGPLPTPELPK